MTVAGTILSGPLSLLVVSLVQAQPAWVSPSVFVDHYHRVRSLPFYLGFALISGSVLMVASIYQLSESKSSPLMALVFSSTAGGLIFFNYVAQTTC